jgi:ribonuclease G
MPKELVISATPHETRVAILEDGQLCEIYVEREKEFALVGSIYKGRVTRILPGMQSAFVDIGLDSDAFLYVSDFLEDSEEYDHIVTTLEGKVLKMEQQGGQVFSSPAAGQTSALEPPEVISPSSEAPGTPAVHAAPAGLPGLAGEARQGSAESGSPPSRINEQRSYETTNYERGRSRRGRWGRRGRSRDRQLPPSKYATPRNYEPPMEPHVPVILPGESLAKYKNLIPPVPPEAVEVKQASATAELIPIVSAENLPAQASPPAQVRESSLGMPTGAVLEASQGPEAPRASQEGEVIPAAVAELTGEEAGAIAEQLADAREEQAEIQAQEAEVQGEEAAESAEVSPAPVETLGQGPVLPNPEVSGRGETGAHDEQESFRPAVLREAEGKAEAGPGESLASEASSSAETRPASAREEETSRARFQRPMHRGGRRRGGPARLGGHPHAHPAATHRTPLISELLKPGQEIIVQIAKEPLGKKGARITSHVALPGRFLVYMPTVDHIGVSRKISSVEERSRLRRLLLELKGKLTGGFILRTAAEGASEEEIRSDVDYLVKTWDEIRTRAEQRKAPALLHRDLDLVERILRDYLSPDYTAIWIDSEEEFSKVVEFVNRFQPQLVNRVKLYTKETPIFEELGIQQEIDKSLRPKVWLKSGGYIVINHTEALVAIDVNTGKFVGKCSTRLEDTIVRTNLEAVKEVVRQIRLRDLGGIIVIDFIDMEERKNREKVMQALEEALRSDKAPSKVLSFNEFGLVAITRKRTKQALERVLCQPCPYCTGSGMVKSIPTVCYEIQGEARKMAKELDSESLTLRLHPEIAKALKTRESPLIDELEKWSHKSVIIQADPTLHWEQYDIY